MVSMMIADGQIDDAEVETIRQVYAQLTRKELSPDEIRAEAGSIGQDARNTEESLAGMASFLNEHGKEMVMRAAVMVAAADGTFDEEEKTLLGNIAQAIQMSPAHFRGLMSEMSGSEQVNA